MRINAADTGAAVAILRGRYKEAALQYAKQHLTTMRTARGAAQWRAIVEMLEGHTPAPPVRCRPGWDEVIPCQWGHNSGRAVVYETATGYEWEVFGVARATECPTLEEAQRRAEEVL